MGDFEAAQQKELRRVPVAELLPYAAEQHLKHDTGGYLQIIERRGGAFIERPITAGTPKNRMAQKWYAAA
jgi:hypothetical protein